MRVTIYGPYGLDLSEERWIRLPLRKERLRQAGHEYGERGESFHDGLGDLILIAHVLNRPGKSGDSVS